MNCSKINKKSILIILILALFISILPIYISAESAVPTISVGTVSAEIGDIVTIDVIILENPGVNAMTLKPIYDTSALRLDDVRLSYEIGGQFVYGTKLVWVSQKDIYTNGVYFSLKFTVLEGAKNGFNNVSLSYNLGDICNYDEEDISFKIVSGGVNVNSSSTGNPQIVVGTVECTNSNKVSVPIEIRNNPGFNICDLQVDYNTELIELDSISLNSNIGGQLFYGNKLVWMSSCDIYENGVFFTLNFTIKEGADFKDIDISLFYEPGDVCNYDEENIEFEIISGKIINVEENIIIGDVNLDGKVTATDANYLGRILNGIYIPSSDVTKAADMNQDGKITSTDSNILTRKISGLI